MFTKRLKKEPTKSNTNKDAIQIPYIKPSPEMDSSDGKTPFISIYNAHDDTQIWKVPLSTAITIGRGTQFTIQLNSPAVSRPHCIIYYKNSVVSIKNESKTSTTKLNDKPLEEPALLKKGDIIKCGNITLFVSEIFLPKYSSSSNISGTKYIDV